MRATWGRKRAYLSLLAEEDPKGHGIWIYATGNWIAISRAGRRRVLVAAIEAQAVSVGCCRVRETAQIWKGQMGLREPTGSTQAIREPSGEARVVQGASREPLRQRAAESSVYVEGGKKMIRWSSFSDEGWTTRDQARTGLAQIDQYRRR